ncbi:MAG: hypothetical protein WCJ62_13635, partial [Flavobacterium sp.]
MNADKRHPLLLDRVLASSPHSLTRSAMDPKMVAQVQRRMRGAKPFVLDAQAISRFARVARDLPDLVVEQQEFARAPYEVMWVEFDYRQFWSELKQAIPDDTADATVGYFIDHEVVYGFAGGTGSDPHLCR